MGNLSNQLSLSILDMLPHDQAHEYQACLEFMSSFKAADLSNDDGSANTAALQTILEESTKALESMKRLRMAVEFLGAVELGKSSTSDQDILNNFHHLEKELEVFNSFSRAIQVVREQVIRMMSCPNYTLH